MSERSPALFGIAIGLCLLGIALAGVGLSLADPVPPVPDQEVIVETEIVYRDHLVTPIPTPHPTRAPTSTPPPWHSPPTPTEPFRSERQTHARSETS